MPDSARSSTFATFWRRIPTGLVGGVFWLALWFALLWLVRLFFLPRSLFFAGMQVLVGIVLLSLSTALAVRFIRRHFLWSLRNKLILTYVLVGLAPIIMLVTLTLFMAWVATGQFSIHLADSRIHQELDDLSAQNARSVAGAARIMSLMDSGAFGPPRPRQPLAAGRRQGPQPLGRRPSVPTSAASATAGQASVQEAQQTAAEGLAQATPSAEGLPDQLRARLRPRTRFFLNGTPYSPYGPQGAPGAAAASASAPQNTSLGFPAWATDLRDREFHALVLDGDDLYLVAIDQRRVEGKGILTSITSLPVDDTLMDLVARGLGSVQVTGLRLVDQQVKDQPLSAAASSSGSGGTPQSKSERRHIHYGASIHGGAEPLPVNFYDFRLPFNSTLDTTDWDTGQPAVFAALISVQSRRSLLYRQLFGSSLGGIFTRQKLDSLIALCVFFGLVEVLALWMAIRLFRALTSSVHELYEATRRIDRGDFVHLIPAEHVSKQDQLGELSRSFNRMTGSLARLLVEQQEKERLQGELNIAQEVQANLFPHHIHSLPTLELHGICRPARTVSGDYYDFFVFHGPGSSTNTHGPEIGVGIALGDISGKGISAALLMATLHSAVRAYRLVSEDLAVSGNDAFGSIPSTHPPGAAVGPSAPSTASGTPVLSGNGSTLSEDGAIFASPARILSLVNRHLYTSTQPEKYATLFLAHYDAATARLVYSNGGHLPPIILGRDGSIRRLDRGGRVVGLLPGGTYEEGSVVLRSGDIFIGYSDGITEPENDFGEFGEARLIEIVARYRDQPLDVISAQVMLALDGWIGAAEQPDDITLVLARQV